MVTSIAPFSATWKHIIATLRTKCEAEGWGIDTEQIVAGNWKANTVIAPPAIIAYLTPGKSFDTQNIFDQVATLNVYTITGESDASDSGEEIVDVTGQAIALAWKAQRALQGMGLTVLWPRDKVKLDMVQDGWAAALVQCEVWYKEVQ